MQDIIEQYKDHIIDPNTQQKLNQPITNGTGFSEGHEEFLKMLIGKIESGEINTLDIKTLFNKLVYDKLAETEKEKTDITALNIMGVIRQIEQLWRIDHIPTFQVQNLVETVFQMKRKFESRYGDVYII
jgi:hypothetical protein